MKLDKSEIAEELSSLRDILRAGRRRRRELQRQLATRGSNVDPVVRIEIEDITAQIRAHEVEVTQLETLAAEDQFPIAEAEYRALLATAWSIPEERYTVAVVARLELQRLQLGIAVERAREIEQTIRSALARETFYRLRKNMFTYTAIISRLEWSKVFDSKPDVLAEQEAIDVSHDILRIAQSVDQIQLIGRCIYIDPMVAADLFVKALPVEQARIMGITDLRYDEGIRQQLQLQMNRFLSVLDLQKFRRDLLDYNNIWSDEEICLSFDDFSDLVEKALANRQPAKSL